MLRVYAHPAALTRPPTRRRAPGFNFNSVPLAISKLDLWAPRNLVGHRAAASALSDVTARLCLNSNPVPPPNFKLDFRAPCDQGYAHPSLPTPDPLLDVSACPLQSFSPGRQKLSNLIFELPVTEITRIR